MSEALAERLRLIVVTDPDCGPGRTVVEVVRAALRGGTPAIQLRMKDGPGREMAALAEALLAETRRAGALLFVNDRVDVALAAGADGAHVGQDDLPVAAARRIVPPGFLLGVSAETAELARRAEADGADYVGVGPIYATGSKADAGEAVGVGRMAEVAAAVRIPAVGIGGITLGNARPVLDAGAAGIAVISAVMRADDPQAAARALLLPPRRSR
ncbi:MAG TPA: thiamine phosphate synthase [Longimicrobium sp.]|nr:thiamine phosphate synthase [Longimicrobium sp.]